MPEELDIWASVRLHDECAQKKPIPNGHEFWKEALCRGIDNRRQHFANETRHLESACSDLLRLVDDYTGTQVDHVKWAKGNSSAGRNVVQTRKLAEMLEVAGFDPWQKDRSLKIVGACTGLVKELIPVKDINFFPVVQARKRKRMLEQVSAFIEMERDQSPIRMWTLTSGPRFPLYDGDLGISTFRKKHALHLKEINRLNDYVKAKYGIELLFRGTEIAGGKEGFSRDDRGRPTFHLHSHVAVRMPRVFSKDEFSSMINDVRKFYGHVMRDDRLDNPREMIKYVCKPSHMIEQLTAPELNQVRQCMHGLSYSSPLGSCRSWRKHLRENRLRVTRLGGGWHTVKDWNSSTGDACVSREESKRTPSIVAITQPAPVFAPMREPCFVVMNWDGESPLHYNEFQQEVADRALLVHTTSLVARQQGSPQEIHDQVAHSPP